MNRQICVILGKCTNKLGCYLKMIGEKLGIVYKKRNDFKFDAIKEKGGFLHNTLKNRYIQSAICKLYTKNEFTVLMTFKLYSENKLPWLSRKDNFFDFFSFAARNWKLTRKIITFQTAFCQK